MTITKADIEAAIKWWTQEPKPDYHIVSAAEYALTAEALQEKP